MVHLSLRVQRGLSVEVRLQVRLAEVGRLLLLHLRRVKLHLRLLSKLRRLLRLLGLLNLSVALLWLRGDRGLRLRLRLSLRRQRRRGLSLSGWLRLHRDRRRLANARLRSGLRWRARGWVRLVLREARGLRVHGRHGGQGWARRG